MHNFAKFSGHKILWKYFTILQNQLSFAIYFFKLDDTN